VPLERLFSTAEGIITEHQARLLPDNAERLIFLKYNARWNKAYSATVYKTIEWIEHFS